MICVYSILLYLGTGIAGIIPIISLALTHSIPGIALEGTELIEKQSCLDSALP